MEIYATVLHARASNHIIEKSIFFCMFSRKPYKKVKIVGNLNQVADVTYLL